MAHIGYSFIKYCQHSKVSNFNVIVSIIIVKFQSLLLSFKLYCLSTARCQIESSMWALLALDVFLRLSSEAPPKLPTEYDGLHKAFTDFLTDLYLVSIDISGKRA